MRILEDILNVVTLFVILALVVAAVCAPLVLSELWWANNECGDFGRQVGYPVKWSVWSGCYVHIEGQWVPQENFWQYVRLATSGGQ